MTKGTGNIGGIYQLTRVTQDVGKAFRGILDAQSKRALDTSVSKFSMAVGRMSDDDFFKSDGEEDEEKAELKKQLEMDVTSVGIKLATEYF